MKTILILALITLSLSCTKSKPSNIKPDVSTIRIYVESVNKDNVSSYSDIIQVY